MGLRQDIITRGSGEILSDDFEIRINGVSYDDKKEGGAALIAAARESKTPERTMIGDYKGFKLYSRFDAFSIYITYICRAGVNILLKCHQILPE